MSVLLSTAGKPVLFLQVSRSAMNLIAVYPLFCGPMFHFSEVCVVSIPRSLVGRFVQGLGTRLALTAPPKRLASTLQPILEPSLVIMLIVFINLYISEPFITKVVFLNLADFNELN